MSAQSEFQTNLSDRGKKDYSPQEEEEKKEEDNFTFKLLKPAITSLGRIGGSGEQRNVGIRMDIERNALLKKIVGNTATVQISVFG